MKGWALAIILAIALASANTAMAYVELDDLRGKMPDRDLVAALDDNQDGEIDTEVWQQIQQDVQDEIDGVLGQAYTVPFPDPIPAVVKLAAKRFAVEAVYARRNLVGEKQPWVVDANASRKKLSSIANGNEPLWPDKGRSLPSGSVISEPAKTFSKRSGT